MPTCYQAAAEPDIFVSNAGDSGANADTILDYSFVEGDKLDFRDLLTAPFNTGDLVSDFVHFTVSGSDIVVEVDVDGAAGGANFVTAATLKNYGASNQNLVDVVLDNTLSATTVAITSVTDDVGPITGALTSGGVTDDTVLALAGSITGTLLADEVVAVYDGATRLGTATVGGGGTSWTYTDNTLANGNVVIYTARVEDAVGQQGAASAAFTTIIDTAAPSVTVNIADDLLNDVHNASTVTFTFSEATTNFGNDDVLLVGGTSAPSPARAPVTLPPSPRLVRSLDLARSPSLMAATPTPPATAARPLRLSAD